jgi:hypothetical protein
MADAGTYRELGEAAWSWVLAQIRDDNGPWLPEVARGATAGGATAGGATAKGAATPEAGDDAPQPAGDRDSLYAGIAGLAPVLAEIALSRPLMPAERSLALGVGRRLSDQAAVRDEPSLYDGLGGDVVALRLLSPGQEQIALRRLAGLRTPGGWNTTLDVKMDRPGPITDLIMGTTGVVLAAAWAGGDVAAEIMGGGGEALLRVAERTEGGLDWRMWPGYRSSTPNYSHGTAGVATALAVAGHALRRRDFIDAARQGAEHLLAVGSLDGGGFVVPHTLPYSERDVEPLTYNWCHGPAGTSQLFAALASAGVGQVGGVEVGELRRRCLQSVLTSGIPHRLRPGFWDNDGRCCGTAGVGDILLDAAQDCPEEAAHYTHHARLMGDALVERAIRDEAGARWRFLEHRQDPPLLPPRTSWMQGAAGIAAFLLRLSRIVQDGPDKAPVVDRPDQWWAVPERLRIVNGSGRPPGMCEYPGQRSQMPRSPAADGVARDRGRAGWAGDGPLEQQDRADQDGRGGEQVEHDARRGDDRRHRQQDDQPQ